MNIKNQDIIVLLLSLFLSVGLTVSCSHQPKIEYLTQRILDIKDTSANGLYVSNEEITVVINEEKKHLEIFAPYGVMERHDDSELKFDATNMFFVSSIGSKQYLDYEPLNEHPSLESKCFLSDQRSYEFVAKHIRHDGYIIITPFYYYDFMSLEDVTLVIPCGGKWSEYEDRIALKRALFTVFKQLYETEIIDDAPEYADRGTYCQKEKFFFLASQMSNPRDYLTVCFTNPDAEVKTCSIFFRCSDSKFCDRPQSEADIDGKQYVKVALGPDSMLSTGASILEDSFDFWGSLLSGTYSENNRRGTLLEEEYFRMQVGLYHDPVYASEAYCLMGSKELYSRIVDIFTNTYTSRCRITIPMERLQNGVTIKYNKTISVVKDNRFLLY